MTNIALKPTPLALTLALGLSLASTAAQANIVVTYTEVGNQVQGVLDGSLDTSFFGTGTILNNVVNTSFSPSEMRFGPFAVHMLNYTVPGSFQSFVSSNGLRFGTFIGGDPFVYTANVSTSILRVPDTYQSGASLHSEATWNGTVSSLGLLPGATVMNLPGNQTLTVNVVVPSAVPEPANAALLALGLAGLGLWRRGARSKGLKRL